MRNELTVTNFRNQGLRNTQQVFVSRGAESVFDHRSSFLPELDFAGNGFLLDRLDIAHFFGNDRIAVQ